MPRQYKLAIVGSRDYPDLEQVRNYIRELQPQWVRCVISGAAPGVDRAAAEEARERGFPVHEFPAEWERFGRRAGHLRNRQLAEAADVVVAFWDESSRGTLDTLRHARALGRVIRVYGPWGPISRETVDALLDGHHDHC